MNKIKSKINTLLAMANSTFSEAEKLSCLSKINELKKQYQRVRLAYTRQTRRWAVRTLWAQPKGLSVVCTPFGPVEWEQFALSMLEGKVIRRP